MYVFDIKTSKQVQNESCAYKLLSPRTDLNMGECMNNDRMERIAKKHNY